jgi:hypothetical protein
MGKRMNKKNKMIRRAAVFVTLATVAVLVRAIMKKRRPRITYGPMHERDQQRIDYLNNKIWRSAAENLHFLYDAVIIYCCK